MSAETLRRAAALMRERAESTFLTTDDGALAGWHTPEDLLGTFEEDGDGDFVASMTPSFALAVADWLDGVAARLERRGPSAFIAPTDRPALAVARAYLGEAS